MPTYTLTTDEGGSLSAQFEIERSAIVLHSRGGSKGKNETNPDYSVALRLILRRMSESGMTIKAAWVDSTRVQELPISARMILDEDDVGFAPEELFKRMSARMQKVGRVKDALPTKGNANKRIRLQLTDDLTPKAIANTLKAVPSNNDLRSQHRLPAEELNKVDAEHIWKAIQLLLGGYENHGFGESTDFDLITDDGERLSPKAVFGIAATDALNFKVMPKHFSGGNGSACFRILKAAGYAILPKQTDGHPVAPPTVATDEQWTEGKPRLVTHVRKERGVGLISYREKGGVPAVARNATV
jgi:5-methylcytosine-specific restriction protein A